MSATLPPILRAMLSSRPRKPNDVSMTTTTIKLTPSLVTGALREHFLNESPPPDDIEISELRPETTPEARRFKARVKIKVINCKDHVVNVNFELSTQNKILTNSLKYT